MTTNDKEVARSCSRCGSANLRIDKCRCGIPCMIFCLDCNEADHNNPNPIPHKRINPLTGQTIR